MQMDQLLQMVEQVEKEQLQQEKYLMEPSYKIHKNKKFNVPRLTEQFVTYK